MIKEKILIVHNYYQVPGGEDTVVINEKNMLEQNGHEVYLYSRHNDEIKEMGLWSKLKIPFQTIYSLKTIKDIKKIIKEKKIDVVHVHNTLPLISPSVYKAAKDCGVKVVQTVHNFRLVCPGATFYRDGDVCEDCISRGLGCAIKHKCYRNSSIQTLVSVMMMKFNRLIGSYDKVDAYIALTEFNKEKISTVIPKEKIFVKPNFTEKLDIDIVPAEQREYFMFLGRLDKLKGIKLLLEAWKDINDEKLVIVGTGPEEDWCKKFILDNNITNIDLIGFRGKEEAMKILSKAKALVVPSQCYETFGLVVIEGLMLSTPVISTRIGALGEIIEENKNGFFIKKDLSNLNDKIKKLKSNNINNTIKEFNKKNNYGKEKNYNRLSEIYQGEVL